MYLKRVFANPAIFQSVSQWALEYPIINGVPITKEQETNWGNAIINQQKNNQWTTKLGEHLVFECLRQLEENPRRPNKKGFYRPDWETDDYIYEVKTRSWTTKGTAGEKVLGSSLKYAEVPELYNKPLRIVCVAFQEYELIYGNTPILGKYIRPNQQKILNYYKYHFNIEYIGCSDLIFDINKQIGYSII